MAVAEFSVRYDGRSVDHGEIPVHDLAPALLALGDLFADASKTAHPDRPPVSLGLRAPSAGSFLVDLILHSPDTSWDELVDIFGSDGATALANLRDAVLSAWGLFAFIKELRGRKIHLRDHHQTTDDMVKVTLTDGTIVEYPARTIELYDRAAIRRDARRTLEPLASDGIEEISFKTDQASEPVTLAPSDVASFDVPDEDGELLSEDNLEMVLSVASPSFVDGNKWRFSTGASTGTFFAAVADDAVLRQVEAGEPFRKGDMLRSQVHITQTRRDSGLHTEHTITKVLQHIPAGTQLDLLGDGD